MRFFLWSFLLCAAGGWAQESTAALENPFRSEADVARGQRTYMAQCAACHGADGRGGNAGPDLSTGNFKRASSDEGLFQVINKGVPGTVMPASSLNPTPIWQLVAYIRSLSFGRTNKVAGGDALRGGKIYGAMRCGGCHESWAPDLAGIGAKRSVAEIRKAVLDPQAEVAPAWWRLRAETLQGEKLSGQRLNEDSYSIQFRDAAGRLRSVPRKALKSVEMDTSSAMPAYQGKLSEAEVNDLIAHLLEKGAAQ